MRVPFSLSPSRDKRSRLLPTLAISRPGGVPAIRCSNELLKRLRRSSAGIRLCDTPVFYCRQDRLPQRFPTSRVPTCAH